MTTNTTTILSKENLETGRIWAAEYHCIDPQPHFEQRWKLQDDHRDPLTILRLLPDLQQPQLPEGYLWCNEGGALKILKHQDAPSVNFTTYLFGPDEKNRIQYLATQNDFPTQGFAMTKQEGFPKDLRGDYGSITPESFKEGETTYWRGHIIDYDDTLGNPSQRDQISAVFSLNLKPEPQVCWARNLRTQLVAQIREENGSYAETMFYGFTPKKTNGGRPIPEAVSFDRFSYGGRAGAELLKSYYVPKEHECHTWFAKKGEKNFVPNSLKKLESADVVSPLIWNQGSPPKQPDSLPFNVDLASLDVKQGYLLRLDAETEYNRAQLKLSYVIYGVTHQAPRETVNFWVKRTIDTALKIEEIFHSVVPPFQLALLGSLPSDLPRVEELQKIAGRVLQACPGMIHRPLKKEEEEAVEARAAQHPPAVSSPILKKAPDGVQPTTICCKHIDTKNPGRVEMLIQEEIQPAIERGSPLVLTQVYTTIANKIFPIIGRIAKERFLPPYQPVQSITITHPKWKNTVTQLARTHFGYQGTIEVDPC